MGIDPYAPLGLTPLRPDDRAIVQPYLDTLRQPLSDYTFAQLCTWRNSLRIFYKIVEGHLCVFANGSGDLTLLMPPIGDSGSDRALGGAFEIMDAYNAAVGVPQRSRVEYVSDELLARFDRTGVVLQPLGSDYIYDTARMIDLPGGDLASKRQAKNRFMRNYSYRVEPYDSARHLDGCARLLGQWKSHQDAAHLADVDATAVKRQKESLACDLALREAELLGLNGMVVYTGQGDDEVLSGFTLGERLGQDQSSILIEKTDLQVKGLAQFIFSEFCRTCWSDLPQCNVGDDWGIESLAWTKMSYRPVKLLAKHILRRAAVARVAVIAQNVEPSWSQRPAGVLPIGQVRSARREDVAATAALEQACFTTHRLHRRQLQYLQRAPGAVFLVGEVDGAVVAEGIGLIRRGRRGLSGRIYSLAVSPPARGHGLGRRLLEAMIQAMDARGVVRVYLEVESDNAAAIGLYEKSGFRRIGTLPNYYGPARDGVHMLREMPAPAPHRAAASNAA